MKERSISYEPPFQSAIPVCKRCGLSMAEGKKDEKAKTIVFREGEILRCYKPLVYEAHCVYCRKKLNPSSTRGGMERETLRKEEGAFAEALKLFQRR